MPTDRLKDALEAARVRGRGAVLAIIQSDEMLDVEAAALMMDCSLPDLLAAHKHGFVLGLEHDGQLHVPDWQFRYDGQPFEEIADMIAVFDKRFWEIYRFMKASHPALGGMTAIDVMQMSREPRLKSVAENWIEGGYA
jgi:hypothetical protein